jgi:hypothetical protein
MVVAVLLSLVLKQVTHFIPSAVIKRENKITEYTMRSEVHQVALLRFKSSWILCTVLGKQLPMFQKAHWAFICRVKQYKKYHVYELADSMLLKIRHVKSKFSLYRNFTVLSCKSGNSSLVDSYRHFTGTCHIHPQPCK